MKCLHEYAQNATPYEVITGSNLHLSNLQIFGTEVQKLKRNLDSGNYAGIENMQQNPYWLRNSKCIPLLNYDLGPCVLKEDVRFIEKLIRKMLNKMRLSGFHALNILVPSRYT